MKRLSRILSRLNRLTHTKIFMDIPPYIKRLVILLVVSLIIIFVSKYFLSRTVKNLDLVSQAKHRTKTTLKSPDGTASLPNNDSVTTLQSSSTPTPASSEAQGSGTQSY